MNQSKVDVVFRLVGKELPLDHGYQLFSAISRHVPDLHGSSFFGVHPIPGAYMGAGRLALGKEANLSIRTEPSLIPMLLPLAGKALDLEGSIIRVGVPSIFPLNPAPSLWSRVVNIKGFMEPEPFKKAAERQLDTLGVKGSVEVGNRVPFRVKDKKIVGFSVKVMGLKPGDSLTLQNEGIGGRRRMGCGIFIPSLTD